MFHLAEAKLLNMLRTTRSLLLAARRHLREDIRQEEGVEDAKKELKEAIASGNVDEVERVLREMITAWEERMRDLPDVEEKVVLAEGRSIQKFVLVEKEFQHVVEGVKQLSESVHNDQFREELGKILALLVKYQGKFTELAKLEENSFESEFRVLLRQEEHKFGDIQNLVLTIDERMQTMRYLWKERGLTRSVKKDLEQVEKEEHALLREIRAAHQEVKEGNASGIKKLKELTKELETYLDRLYTDWNEMLKMFLLIVKMIVNIDFLFEKKSEFFLQVLEELKKEGFPAEELNNLKKRYGTAKERIDEKNKFVLDVARRLMRLALAKA